MNITKSPNSKSSNILNLISKNWVNLDESQKSILTKIWNVITYKWQFQILLNFPFLIWWLLDKSFDEVHNFDLRILSYLNLPDWALSLMGFGQ